MGRERPVVSALWQGLADACTRAQDAGQAVEFWWRDDDATVRNAAVERLLSLAESTRVPVALAVIPDLAHATLVGSLGPYVSVLQHGCDHRNRAPAGEKKNEFPRSEPAESALQRLRTSRDRLRTLSEGRALDVLVPPWNRLSPALLPQLREAGFRGLSRFGNACGGDATRGLRELDTHVDIVDWAGGRRFAGEAAVLERAARVMSAAPASTGTGNRGPIGWLTHHACHDEAAWRFLERLFDESRRWAGVRWIAGRDYFSEAAAG